MTTTVVFFTSPLDGQVTFLSSLFTSAKKLLSSLNFLGPQPIPPASQAGVLPPSIFSIFLASATAMTFNPELPGAYVVPCRLRPPARRPSRVAGQEGLEPPTPGFGDRCSTIELLA